MIRMPTTPNGLTDDEAARRLSQYGANTVGDQRHTPAIAMFFRQVTNILVLLLVGAGIFSFVIGEKIDAGFIFFIVVVNAIFGFIQEYKAENAINALRQFAISKVRAIRNGKEQLVKSTELVPGDIVKLAEGDKVPADGELLFSSRLEINEASLTGESLPVEKDYRNNDGRSVFMGTIVAAGSGMMKITATGVQTKFGKLAASLANIPHEQTPLMKKIAVLGTQLTLLALAITVLIFLLGIAQGESLIRMLLTSISLAVAAVPEGLPAVITITLAVGLQRMARQKAILRKLSAIEALGNTTIIVTDKTGTLTENKMRVQQAWVAGSLYPAEKIVSPVHNHDIKEFIKTGILCNEASLIKNKKTGGYDILGDQTEGSLLLLAKDAGFSIKSVNEKGRLLDTFQFDQKRKLMSTLWEEDGEKNMYAKGAPESILERSSHIQLKGKRVVMTERIRKETTEQFQRTAAQGYRMLALAKRERIDQSNHRDDAEHSMTFLGFVAIHDPARPETRNVIRTARSAGIETIMVTGDNPLTAESIGRQIGLFDDDDVVMTGQQLATLSDKQLLERLGSLRIIARATPEDKFRIVKLLQYKKHVVTVTGDGINDALALKQADIGVAMGITGTDVAKEVSDMVITDDNYATIVHAIREGRIIYDNIVKSITYLLSCNLGEVLIIFGALIVSLFLPSPIPVPLLPVHILWINLVTDGLPALSLAFDPGTPSVMQRRNFVDVRRLINRESLGFILPVGTVIASLTLLLFIVSLLNTSESHSQNLAFTFLVIFQLAVVFLVRKNQSFFSNKLLLISVLVSMILQFVALTFAPLVMIFFKSA